MQASLAGAFRAWARRSAVAPVHSLAHPRDHPGEPPGATARAGGHRRHVTASSIHPTAGDPVALVTGGSWGAGRELVRALARRGFAVVVVYLRDQRAAEVVVQDVVAQGGAAVAVRADVTDDLDVQRVFDESAAAFGGVDLVVHAARRGAALVLRHAERRLRRGGTTVDVSRTGDVAGALALVDGWGRRRGP